MKNLKITLTIGCLALLIGTSANAASILFGRVGSTSYVADGQDLVDYLVAGGNTVDYVDLNTTVVSDFSSYSQIWVYDLVTGSNNSTNQQTNYANIANWYNNTATDKNLIADGRIISSSFRWTDLENTNPSRPGLGTGGEPEWIRNYATQLEAVGGGLMLGTDHNAFHSGINTINNLININPFVGFYDTPPLEALVDSASDLFIPGLEPCTNLPAESCINDNSSTGFAPTGAQPNGQFLTPVAYHGNVASAFDLAAVSATFTSPTFSVPEPSLFGLLGAGLLGLRFMRLGRVTRKQNAPRVVVG